MNRPIGLALRFDRSVAVMVHSGGNVSVAHEFLLYAQRSSGFVEPGTVAVAAYVKTDPAQPQFDTCRNQVLGTDRVGVIGPAGYWTWKDPAVRGFRAQRLPFCQLENKAPFERHLVLGVFGFQFVDSFSDRRSLDQDDGSLEVEIRPAPA